MDDANPHNDPVLVIDDDEAWLKILDTALKKQGWSDIRCLSDPTHALHLAREFHPGLVILDLNMAQRDGRDLLRAFSEELPDLPVIVVTGVDDLDEAVACLRRGAVDYCTKPLQRERFEAACRRAREARNAQQADHEDLGDALPHVQELPDLKEVPDLLIEEALRRSDGG
ncbi:MAG: response regulator, partial [Planctomycetota bacterium]